MSTTLKIWALALLTFWSAKVAWEERQKRLLGRDVARRHQFVCQPSEDEVTRLVYHGRPRYEDSIAGEDR